MSLRPWGGLDLAAWPDGLVLFAPDRLRAGENLRVGRIPPAAVERVLSLCTELGFFDLRYRSEGVMHASPLRMSLRRGEATRSLALDTTDSSSSSHRSLVTAWFLLDRMLQTLVPETSLPLVDMVEDGKLRGFRTR